MQIFNVRSKADKYSQFSHDIETNLKIQEKQDAQLSQRPRCRVRYSFRQK